MCGLFVCVSVYVWLLRPGHVAMVIGQVFLSVAVSLRAFEVLGCCGLVLSLTGEVSACATWCGRCMSGAAVVCSPGCVAVEAGSLPSDCCGQEWEMLAPCRVACGLSAAVCSFLRLLVQVAVI